LPKRTKEDSYSIKKVERLYRPKRATEVATAVDSIVQYARWIESKQPGDWAKSPILKGIRDYNEDDCKSTAELLMWVRKVATANKIPRQQNPRRPQGCSSCPGSPKEISPDTFTNAVAAANQWMASYWRGYRYQLTEVTDIGGPTQGGTNGPSQWFMPAGRRSCRLASVKNHQSPLTAKT
jgi:hypothetical protein